MKEIYLALNRVSSLAKSFGRGAGRRALENCLGFSTTHRRRWQVQRRHVSKASVATHREGAWTVVQTEIGDWRRRLRQVMEII